MMRLVKGLIITMYLVVYAYSVNKTSIEPEKVIWGYICVLVFLILTIWGLSFFTKNNKSNDN